MTPPAPQRFATLQGVRVLTVGIVDGAAHRAGRLLVDLGATARHLDPPRRQDLSGAVPVTWDVLVVEGQPAMVSSWLPEAVTGVVCVISTLPGEAEFDESAELAAQAAAGFLWANGEIGDPPIQCGVPLAQSAGALAATLAVVAALRARKPDDPMDLVVVDQVDLLLGSLGTLLPHYLLSGHEPPRLGNRHALTAPWNSYPGADGWVVLATMGERQWATVAAMIGHPELVSDPRFVAPEDRIRNAEELDAIIGAWTNAYPKLDLVKLADEAGVPLSTVLDVAEALAHPAWAHRTQWAADATETRMFFRSLSGERRSAAPPSPVGPGTLPLTGLRVLEFGLYTAAPLAGKLLAQLGADVLKVEPPGGEPGRQLGSKLHGSSYLYYLNNTDKRGCVVDMTDPAGRAVMTELVAGADVFLTNLSLDGLGKSGLGFDDLEAVNPRLIYCSISGYGATGPYAGRRVLDTVMQAMSGIMHLTGRGDGPPQKVAVSICDLMAAWVAAISVVAAWRDTEITSGRAQFLDVSMLDASMWLVDGARNGANPAALHRSGTADPAFAIHDVYRSVDGLVALSVREEAKLHTLIVDMFGSQAHGDPVAVLLDWIARTPSASVVSELRDHGVPAAPVLRLSEAAAPALIELPLNGGTHQVFGSAFKWPHRGVSVHTAAPGLGQHEARWLPRTEYDDTDRKVQQ